MKEDMKIKDKIIANPNNISFSEFLELDKKDKELLIALYLKQNESNQ